MSSPVSFSLLRARVQTVSGRVDSSGREMLLIQSGQSRLDRQPVPLHGTGGRCGHGRDRGRAGERVHTLFLPCSVIYSTHSDSFSLSSEREVKNRFKTSVKYGDICRSSRCLRSSEGFFFHCFTAHVPQFIFLIVFQTEKWGGSQDVP